MVLQLLLHTRRQQVKMEVAVTEEYRGKRLKLNFTIMLTLNKTEKLLSTVYNIDNLAEARFKFVYPSTHTHGLQILISLKKHVRAKDSVVKVDVDVSKDIQNNSRQWLCTENWIDWQPINNINLDEVFDSSNYYYSTSTVNLTVIKEKTFTAEKIYEDEDLTDFTLNTTNGSVSVHKAWLSAHSDVFKAMLCQEWKETAEGHVKIEGVTLQTLQHLKQYMYLGTLPNEGLRSLLLLAMYYLMDELKSECISKLARTATSVNHDELVNFAINNKIPELVFAIIELTSHDVVHGAYRLRETKAVSKKSNKINYNFC